MEPCRNHKTRRIESGVKRRHRSGIRDGKITYLRECWGNRSNLVNAAFFTFYTWPVQFRFSMCTGIDSLRMENGEKIEVKNMLRERDEVVGFEDVVLI